MNDFLSFYAKLSKDDIRLNRSNAAERLSFVGRVLHGRNPRSWLKDLRRHLVRLRTMLMFPTPEC
jgi:hypothetical protein